MFRGWSATAIISRIVVVSLLVACLAVTLACQRSDNITYEALGDAETVDVTVSNETGGMEQYNDVPLPWRMDFGGFDSAQPYMYVYNNGDRGTVRISIKVNGKVMTSGVCSGPYANTTIYADR
jgi:hypothetical protein